MNILRRVIFSLFCLALAGAAFARPSLAQSTIFADEFNSGSLSGNWSVYGTDRWLSRTQFGNAPVFGTEGSTKFMRLRLDTYNPTYPGTTLRGTEMHTNAQFGMGSGMQIEARVRAPGLPAGIIWAFFLLGERGTWPDTYSRDEIDFENLTSLASNEIWTNIYNDYNPNISLEGGSEMIKTAAGLNRNNWTIYKIKWYPNRVEWWVNVGSGADILVRSETDPKLVTDDPQSIRFNIWAADSNWSTAYGNLPVTSDPSQNTAYYFDVDYVRMTSIGPRGLVGDGDGLQGNYYDNSNFTGKTISRVDQRVNFDWKGGSPDPSISTNTFSARWTGKVQAMFSETYTFYVKSDDGARLWVNGKQLVNQWKNQGTTEYKGTIALTAGQKYDIKLEYFENIGYANVQLSWSSPSTAKTIVPKSQLYSGYVAPPPPDDTIPPTAIVTSPANGNTYKVVYGASGTAADTGGSGLASVKLTLQRASDNLYYTSGGWKAAKSELAASGTSNWSWGFPYLADGQYSLQAIARDGDGNIGNSSVVTFTISKSGDTTPPSAVIYSPANGNTYKVVYGASGIAVDTGGSGLASVKLTLQRVSDKLYYTSGGWKAAKTEIATSGTDSWSWGFPYLADGKYSLQAIARDGAGNVGYSSVAQFTVDKTVPAIAVIEPKSGQSYSSFPAANGTASDSAGLFEVRCIIQRTSDGRYWNGSQWVTAWTEMVATGTTKWTFTMPSLASGSYSFWAVARDRAGNQTYADKVDFTIQ
jgi:hypothetical protein